MSYLTRSVALCGAHDDSETLSWLGRGTERSLGGRWETDDVEEETDDVEEESAQTCKLRYRSIMTCQSFGNRNVTDEEGPYPPLLGKPNVIQHSRPYSCFQTNFHRLAISMPSASVPTRASMAKPSSSYFLHNAHRSFRGTEKFSMNSFSSNSGWGFRFSDRDRSTVTWIMRRLVLQNPGSVISQYSNRRRAIKTSTS